MGVWLIVLIALCVVAVAAFKALGRRSFTKGREPQSLAEIHESVKDQVSIAIFSEVWEKVGELFSISPQLIRPTDRLKSLARIDSWNLGEGSDALSLWLEKKNLGKPPILETMLDLAKWVEISTASREVTS